MKLKAIYKHHKIKLSRLNRREPLLKKHNLQKQLIVVWEAWMNSRQLLRKSRLRPQLLVSVAQITLTRHTSLHSLKIKEVTLLQAKPVQKYQSKMKKNAAHINLCRICCKRTKISYNRLVLTRQLSLAPHKSP